MNDHDDDDALDAVLRRQFHEDAEPEDAGFSLRVMGHLPARVPPRQLRWARWVKRAHWAAVSLAACGAAALLVGHGTPDGSHALAAGVLLGLVIFWSIPSRWSTQNVSGISDSPMWNRGKRSRSNSTTRWPCRAMSVDAVAPAGPPPITTTGTSVSGISKAGASGIGKSLRVEWPDFSVWCSARGCQRWPERDARSHNPS